MNPRLVTLACGAALILIGNAVVLGMVAYNRSGEPDSRLVLSQRELNGVRNGGVEDDALLLELDWRVAGVADDGQQRNPPWLNAARLSELGFDVQRLQSGQRMLDKASFQSARPVLVVLELAGPAWQQALASAGEHLVRQQALRQTDPESKVLLQEEREAQIRLTEEEGRRSRLFAVDVGTDRASLRARYPDRSRYMIVHGTVSLQSDARPDPSPVVSGQLGELTMGPINIPHAWRGAFASAAAASRSQRMAPERGAPTFTATVAVGQRLEPWIEALTVP